MSTQNRKASKKRRIPKRTSGSAVIEYHGSPGVTQESLMAITNLLQTSTIEKARLLSSPPKKSGMRYHGFFLKTDEQQHIIILPGFTSGYGGEGPHGLSKAVSFLEYHGARPDNLELTQEQYDRLENVCLTDADLDVILTSRRSSGAVPTDYVYERDEKLERNDELWLDVEPLIPYGLIDPRILKIALKFRTDPDKALFDAFRDLEELIKKRSGRTEFGSKLMSAAFLGPDAKLTWKGLPPAEINGRGQRFVSAFMAYRNARAHKRQKSWVDHAKLVEEFLIINELFHLEAQTVKKRKLRKKAK